MNSELIDKLWDVIVIGAGMGGGTIGRKLAEAGLSVLYVEAGPNGPRAERNRIRDDIQDPIARRIRGIWSDPISVTVNGHQSTFFAPMGAGVGGSSVFYAATMERLERHDIDDSIERPHPTGGWPISFDTFRPYFEEAERLFHVCGSQDPLSTEPPATLRDPPELVDGDVAMMETFRRSGLNPHRIHLGVRFLPGCKMCFGSKCPRRCKMDGRSAGVEPALETGNAAVLDMCKARALIGDANTISSIEAERGGEIFNLRAKRFVLAAGALNSPRLLLASKSKDWPAGCANSSGLVGRNLMFHLFDLIAFWPPGNARFDGPSKAIGLRDFYYVNGERYGHVGAMGIEASYGDITHYLKSLFDNIAPRQLRPLRQLINIPARIGASLLGNAQIYSVTLEDYPYPDNRIQLDKSNPDQLQIEYTTHPELLRRRREFRRLLRRKTRGQRKIFLTTKPELNLPHACGTLRFGSNPSTSVLDPFCRAHDIDNLYVVDSSFMPTSTGVNPGLTIAANALRVAEHIVEMNAKAAVRA